jgi:hypothetical protein
MRFLRSCSRALSISGATGKANLTEALRKSLGDGRDLANVNSGHV